MYIVLALLVTLIMPRARASQDYGAVTQMLARHSGYAERGVEGWTLVLLSASPPFPRITVQTRSISIAGGHLLRAALAGGSLHLAM